MPTEAHARFIFELEKLGETEVRYRLNTNVYGNVADHKTLVEAWLQDKERARTSASQTESLSLARAAQNDASRAAAAAERAAAATEAASTAATRQAAAAESANRRATIALLISIASIIVTIIIAIIGFRYAGSH